MKLFGAAIICAMLSGCGCKPDPGDSMNYKDYWDGCWAAAKRQER